MTGLPFGQVPVRIFGHDDAVVYNDTDGQGDAGEGHDVRGKAKGIEQNKADGDGDGNLDDDAEGAAPVKQEQDDDDGDG